MKHIVCSLMAIFGFILLVCAPGPAIIEPDLTTAVIYQRVGLAILGLILLVIGAWMGGWFERCHIIPENRRRHRW